MRNEAWGMWHVAWGSISKSTAALLVSVRMWICNLNFYTGRSTRFFINEATGNGNCCCWPVDKNTTLAPQVASRNFQLDFATTEPKQHQLQQHQQKHRKVSDITGFVQLLTVLSWRIQCGHDWSSLCVRVVVVLVVFCFIGTLIKRDQSCRVFTTTSPLFPLNWIASNWTTRLKILTCSLHSLWVPHFVASNSTFIGSFAHVIFQLRCIATAVWVLNF